jgi:hypothetical protein
VTSGATPREAEQLARTLAGFICLFDNYRALYKAVAEINSVVAARARPRRQRDAA